MRKIGVATVLALAALAGQARAQDPPGKRTFEDHCGACHGADGNGGERAPAITRAVPNMPDAQLIDVVRKGLPARGMPPIQIEDAELPSLITFIRSLQPRGVFQPYRKTFQMNNGRSLDGLVLNEGPDDTQVRSDAGRIHLLRRTTGDKFREVTSDVDWTTYNGDAGGNRYTTLKQIDKSNVRRVAPKWTSTVSSTSPLPLETTSSHLD